MGECCGLGGIHVTHRVQTRTRQFCQQWKVGPHGQTSLQRSCYAALQQFIWTLSLKKTVMVDSSPGAPPPAFLLPSPSHPRHPCSLQLSGSSFSLFIPGRCSQDPSLQTQFKKKKSPPTEVHILTGSTVLTKQIAHKWLNSRHQPPQEGKQGQGSLAFLVT